MLTILMFEDEKPADEYPYMADEYIVITPTRCMAVGTSFVDRKELMENLVQNIGGWVSWDVDEANGILVRTG